MNRCIQISLALAALACATVGCGRTRTENTGLAQQSSVVTPQTPLLAANIPKFVDPLPTQFGRRVNATVTLQIDAQEFQQKVLPASVYASLPAPYNQGTFLWGYNINGLGPSWPARTLEARQNVATTAIYTSSLRNTQLQKLLTVDQTLHWADPLGTTMANNCQNVVNGHTLAAPCLQPYSGPIPTVTHLHGNEVLSAYDGHPNSWFTPGFTLKGPGFVSNTYNYLNHQEATTLWYHDHALGIVRLNVYAGLAGFYFLRDNRDTGLANNPITLPAGAQEIEMMIQDRQFDTNGQLLYPDGTPLDNPTGLNGPPPNADHHPFWIPEFFGDVMTVNGKSWPVLEVQPRRYRFRILNADNARFLLMQLSDQTGRAGPAFWQIGSDGGFLNAPVKLNDPANGAQFCAQFAADPTAGGHCVFLAPAERGDFIVDFSGQFGKTFTLQNFAVFPFPSGGPVDANADGQVMRIKVNKSFTGPDTTFNPAGNHPALRASPIVDIKPASTGRQPDKLRQLILVEEEGSDPDGGSPVPGSPVAPGGPLESLINNSKWSGLREGSSTRIPGSIVNGAVAATEAPQVGSTEVWEVANLTADAHPIHIHLIQFQVISRQAFDVDVYTNDWMAAFPGGTFNGFTFPPGTYIPGFGPPLPYFTPNSAGAIGGNINFDAPKYTQQGACAGGACPVLPPDPIDAGWKDTIKMPPGVITRIVTRWAPQDMPVGAVRAGQNTFPFDPTTGGPGYVEHCHILDHEDNEFMRPMLIVR